MAARITRMSGAGATLILEVRLDDDAREDLSDQLAINRRGGVSDAEKDRRIWRLLDLHFRAYAERAARVVPDGSAPDGRDG